MPTVLHIIRTALYFAYFVCNAQHCGYVSLTYFIMQHSPHDLGISSTFTLNTFIFSIPPNSPNNKHSPNSQSQSGFNTYALFFFDTLRCMDFSLCIFCFFFLSFLCFFSMPPLPQKTVPILRLFFLLALA